VRFGSKVNGRLVAVPETAGDKLTNPGEVYQFDIYTENAFHEQDSELIAGQLMQLENQVADLKIEYIETFPDDGIVTVQIRDAGPGQIMLSGLASLIPVLFIVIGIFVAGFILWQALETNPILLWLGLLAGGVIIFYTFIGGKITPTQVRVSKAKDDKSENFRQKLASLDKERIAYENRSEQARHNKDQELTDVRTLQAEIKELKSKRDKQKTTKDKAAVSREITKVKDRLEAKKTKAEKYEKEMNEASAEAKRASNLYKTLS